MMIRQFEISSKKLEQIISKLNNLIKITSNKISKILFSLKIDHIYIIFFIYNKIL